MTTETTNPAPNTPDTPPAPTAPVVSPEQARIAALETQLATVETALLAEVPAHLKTLVPAGLSVGDRIGWLNQAKAAGLFAAPVPPTDNVKPRQVPTPDALVQMPVAARIAAGYK